MAGAPTSTIERGGRTSCGERLGPTAFACFVSTITAAAAAVVVASSQAQVATVEGTSAPHVRPEHDVRELVGDAARGSPAIRGLIDRLEALDVTVYVRIRAFLQTDLEGRVALLSANGAHRYLVIELACGRPRLSQMATLGHELYHALEIADEPSIVDARTLAAFYGRIGRRTEAWGGRQTFETEAAADAGLRARRELLTNSTRRADDGT
jgi:hypothetical protein